MVTLIILLSIMKLNHFYRASCVAYQKVHIIFSTCVNVCAIYTFQDEYKIEI